MPLIPCPDCGTEVSDKAEACPKCARPLGGTTLIEQTAKIWKMIQIVGAGIMLIGICCILFACSGGVGRLESSVTLITVGISTIVVGLSVLTVAKIEAWWHHG